MITPTKKCNEPLRHEEHKDFTIFIKQTMVDSLAKFKAYRIYAPNSFNFWGLVVPRSYRRILNPQLVKSRLQISTSKSG